MKRDKTMDYSTITNLKELQAERRRLAADIQSKEKEVVNDFSRLRLLLSPVYWVQRAFRSWQTLSTTWSFIMRAYRSIQEFWAQQKAARAAKAQAKAEAAEVTKAEAEAEKEAASTTTAEAEV